MPDRLTPGDAGPRLSIIIPSFRDDRILNTIRSVRRFDNLGCVEIIVIDGGSDSALISACSALLTPTDTLVCEPDKGIFDALNKGLEMATGDYIGWLGSDDVFSQRARASDVLHALADHDIYIARTAILTGNRVRRLFKAWPSAYGLVKYGLHNPHFSTFGRSAIIKSQRFDIDHPFADIGYFLTLFDQPLRIYTDKKLVTLMQAGGASNGSLRKVISINLGLLPVYRRHSGPVRAYLAVFLKLFSKLGSSIYYKIRIRRLDDPLLPTENARR
jgi:glycosyltransferase